MLDCQISLLSYMATMYFLSEEDPYPLGNPIKLSRTDEESFSPAPLLGEVLGCPPDRIGPLKETGIVT